MVSSEPPSTVVDVSDPRAPVYAPVPPVTAAATVFGLPLIDVDSVIIPSASRTAPLQAVSAYDTLPGRVTVHWTLRMPSRVWRP
jgi:hypothetical protein